MPNTKISALVGATLAEVCLPTAAGFGMFPVVKVANVSNRGVDLFQAAYGMGRRYQNTLWGFQAGYALVYAPIPTSNTLIGNRAGYYVAASYNVMVGARAGYYRPTGFDTVIGFRAGEQSKGPYDYSHVFVGFDAAQVGFQYGGGVVIGYRAGQQNTNGSNAVAIGFDAGRYSSLTDCVFVGPYAGEFCQATGQVAIGHSALGQSALGGDGAIGIGLQSGLVNEAPGNLFVGYYSGRNSDQGFGQTIIGNNAGASGSGAGFSYNTFLGSFAGFNSTGRGNVFLGCYTGNIVAAGDYNVSIGYNSDISSGYSRTCGVGYSAYTSEDECNSFGCYAYNRVPATTVIRGTMLTRAVFGGDPNSVAAFSCAVVTLTTGVFNLKTPSSVTLTIPAGARFYLDEVSLITTNVNILATQPTISAGISGNDTKYVNGITTTLLTATGTRESFAITGTDGETSLTATVDVGATGTTVEGRFQFKGVLIEDE